MLRRPLLIWCSAALIGAWTSPAQAEDAEHRLEWKAHWRRFDAIEYAATAAVLGGFLVVEFGVESRDEARWEGGILFDESVRSGAVAESREGRDRAARTSDVLAIVPQAQAFIDTIAIPLATDSGNWDVAWQTTVMNAQAFGFVGLLSRLGHRVVARARPDLEECERDPEYAERCFIGELASFPSGHTSSAAVGAGLVCAHHAYLPLYGGGAADLAACATGIAFSSANGYLRLVADRHYASDVIVGAVLGFGAGFGLPLLLHYRPEPEPTPSAALRWTVVPSAAGDRLGAALIGRF